MTGTSKARILVIDDETDIAELVAKRLRASGYETHLYPRGNNSLEQVRAYRPNLILLDLKMPDITGTEVFNELKRDDELKKIPVIFFTALREEEVQLKKQAPGVPFLKKPYDPKFMMELIRRTLRESPATTQ